MYRRVSVRRLATSAESAPRDIGMPTPLSVGFNMKYSVGCGGINVAGGEQRPLVVMAGWMGAKESQLKPYLKFYHEKNFDALYFAVGPKHVLSPDSAMEHMEFVLSSVADNKGEIGDPSKIVFHHFSMGGYLYGQALIAMQNNPEKFNKVKNKICAQIFDSPPDFNSIATGLSASIGINSVPIKKAVAMAANAYLAATADNVGVKHRAASAAFHGNSTPAPALWYYSKADPVSLYTDCETVCGKWRAAGIEVEECVWDHTPHIQHGRLDPDRYFGTLERFLTKNNIIVS